MGLTPGTAVPLFVAPSPVNPQFTFGSLAGRYVLLAVLPFPGPERDAAIGLIHANASLFDDDRMMFFGILPDPETYAQAENNPPCRWFLDETGRLRRLLEAEGPGGGIAAQWLLLDPTLRVLETAPLDQGARMMARIAALEDPDRHAGEPLTAPALIVPRVFEPDLCQRLIDYYRDAGGTPSGVMHLSGDKTVGVLDHTKRRRDAMITDPDLIEQARSRLARRLVPEILKAYQFRPTRIERHIVACYDAGEGGFFRPHRDNTTPGTAHRRFAVSINLNHAFQGGDLRFPEFGLRTYRPPLGGAVVFSCSLLHEATPVTGGTRYAYLPFLYDDEGARIREQNLGSLEITPPL